MRFMIIGTCEIITNNRTNVRLSILLVAETLLKHSILHNTTRIIIDYEIPLDMQGQCERNGLEQ